MLINIFFCKIFLLVSVIFLVALWHKKLVLLTERNNEIRLASMVEFNVGISAQFSVLDKSINLIIRTTKGNCRFL
jgi:hypothetical protein